MRTNERTNRHGAEDALKVLESASYWGDNDPETDLGDFIAEVRHLCRLKGWDWEKVLEQADYHYRYEANLDWDEERH